MTLESGRAAAVLLDLSAERSALVNSGCRLGRVADDRRASLREAIKDRVQKGVIMPLGRAAAGRCTWLTARGGGRR